MATIKNVKELREHLTANLEKLVNNEMSMGAAKEHANTAGKIIASLKVELEYRRYVGESNKTIPFLETAGDEKVH